MTEPKRWPTNAKEHRDRAAEELQAAVRLLKPLVVGALCLDRTGTINRQSAALAHVQTALRHLEQAGAPTKPD